MKKTYYEILGVPRTATQEQIKRRYRLLARKYHPDVAQDKAAAQAAFIQISEAYQTLSNSDKRTIYDVGLDAEMFRVEPRRSSTSNPSYRPTAPGARPTRTTAEMAAEARGLVAEAQVAFIQGQLRMAETLCKRARNLDKRNLQAHVILGDIYRTQGQVDDAVAMYSVAAQLDPGNKQVMAKLGRLLRQQGKVNDVVARHERKAALRLGISLMGWSMGAFMFIMLSMSPGDPIPWLHANLSLVSTWSTSLITVLLITGALTGFLLSVNESVEPLDDELIFQGVRTMGARNQNLPLGLILVGFNLFNFYSAVIMYTIIGVVQDSLSKSVYKSFVAAFGLVVVAAFVYTPGSDQVLLFGGNVAFLALLFGWGIGDMFRPGW
jgi:hypothetical protein